MKTVDQPTALRLKEKGWVEETYFVYVMMPNPVVDIHGNHLPPSDSYYLVPRNTVLHIASCTWLPAPDLQELQGVVSYNDLFRYKKEISPQSWWPEKCEWLDSALRSCKTLAEVWMWKKGK